MNRPGWIIPALALNIDSNPASKNGRDKTTGEKIEVYQASVKARQNTPKITTLTEE